jgi:hypothetical protein
VKILLLRYRKKKIDAQEKKQSEAYYTRFPIVSFIVVLTLSGRLLTSLPTLFVVFNCVSYSIVTVATATMLKYDVKLDEDEDGADVDDDE